MTPCTFLFDTNFKFHDGERGQKIFVVLNNGGSGQYVAAKSTSRGDRYGIRYGCQILDRFPNFNFVKGSCFLNKNTWIQLDAFYEFNVADLRQKVMSGQINRIGVLDTAQALELLICTSHSEDLSQLQESLVLQTIKDIKKANANGTAS
ncbi:MAG: hypothetical protein U5S82_16680 [Gammaproteobacteria bacterium]|nr:hypothetical protein [Gammaproteobacteria bacterium]